MLKNNFITRRLDDYKSLDGKGKRLWWGDFFVRNAIYIIIIALVIYVQIYSIQNDFKNNFFSFPSIMDVIMRSSSALFLALGVGGIIVMTGTDLSAGRIQGLTACVSASLLQLPWAEYAPRMFRDDFLFPHTISPIIIPMLMVMLFVMVVGGLLGVFNGFFVSKFKLHPFIVTLATQLMVYGIVLWYVQQGYNGGTPISGLIEPYKTLVKGTIEVFGTQIPYYVFYAIGATVIMWFIWNRTTLGKNMYAVGANPDAANVSGVSVMKTTIFIFMIAGILYGFAGFVEAARTGSNSPTTGVNNELDAIAACVIGGVSFTGGTGKISGIITGVILLAIISVALQWLSVSGELQFVIKGALILIAVTIDMRKYLAKK